MKLRSRLLPLLAATALVAAACGNDEELVEEPDEGVEETEDAEDAEDEATEEDEATDDEATDDEATEEDAADTGAEPAGTVVTGLEIGDSPLGEHIVTDAGITTYAAIDQLDGEVICVGDCAQVWAPVIADGDVAVDDGIDAEVTTIALDDGREQVAVDGAPLHTFVGDPGPGDARGQGSADRWFVVSPAGELVDAPDPADLEDDEADEDDEGDEDA